MPPALRRLSSLLRLRDLLRSPRQLPRRHLAHRTPRRHPARSPRLPPARSTSSGGPATCRPPAAWGHAELSFASSMGPPVRQLWDHPGSEAAEVPLPGYTRCQTVRRIWEAAVAFREVGVHEIREVLRLWVRGEGFRSVGPAGAGGPQDGPAVCGGGAGAAAWTGTGVRGSSATSCSAAVAERVRPHRADGHGEAWAVLAAHHARLEELLDAGLTVVKAGELLARRGCGGPGADAAPVRAGGAWAWPRPEADGAGGRRRAGRRMPGRLREDGPA